MLHKKFKLGELLNYHVAPDVNMDKFGAGRNLSLSVVLFSCLRRSPVSVQGSMMSICINEHQIAQAEK
jgi:hypothetical protein